MAKLTDWLDSFKVSPVPRHDKYPALVKPPNFFERLKSQCVSCIQGGKENHDPYGCGKLTAELPLVYRVNIRIFMLLQYLLHRISSDIYYPYGAQAGFVFYGDKSINFANRYGFKVTSVVGQTVEVETYGGSDIRAMAIFTIMKSNWGTNGRSFLTIYGAPQANDIAEPGSGCVLYGKLVSRLLKVTVSDTDFSKATFVFEHDMSGLLVDAREDQTDEFVPSVSLIRQAAEPEQWTRIVRPSFMKCQRRVITVRADQLPADKKLSLTRSDGTDGRVADYEAAVEATGKPATMQIWFKRVAVEELEDVTATVVSRLKKDSTGPGFDGKGAYKSFLCLGTKDHKDEDSFTNLIDGTVESISVVYWAEVPDGYTGTDWCAVGSRSCVHAVRDESGSYYAMDYGEAHTESGEEYFCDVSRTWEIVETDDGKWRVKYSSVDGVAKFTGDCSLNGVCSAYQPKHTASEGSRSFTLHRTANQILKEVTIGHDIALIQYWPGYPYYYVKRVGRPTIHGLIGRVPTSNPTDWSPNVQIIQGSCMFGNFDTAPHPTESGTILDPLSGAAWDGRVAFSSLTFPEAPPPGTFPTNIAGWTDRIDALRRPIDNTIDPYFSTRYYEDDMSARVSRGVNTHTFGRGVSQTSRIVAADEKFFLPKLSCKDETAGQAQDRGECVFTWYNSEQTGPDGFKYWFKIEFKKLMATGKEEVGEITSAVITAASHDGFGTIKVELANQPITYSRLKNLGIGNTFNETFTINTGGGIFRPPDHLQIMSSETADSSYGGANDWVSIGDSVWIDMDDDEFKAHRFTITGGGAYRGSTAADFGSGKIFVSFDLANGYYQIPEADLKMTGTDEIGNAGRSEATTSAAATASDTELFFSEDVPFIYQQFLQVDGTDEVLRVTGTDYPNKKIFVDRGVSSLHAAQPIPAGAIIRSVSVYEWASGKVYESISSETKPTSIDSGKFWYDSNAARYYFSALDKLKHVELSFTVTDESGVASYQNTKRVDNHEIFSIVVDGETYAFPVIDTDKTDAEFTGSGAATKVFIGDTEFTLITTGLPNGTNALKTIDSNSHVVLQFDDQYFGESGRLEIDPGTTTPFNLDSPALVPEFATGIGWGKKHAVAEFKDEHDWCKDRIGDLVGKTIHFEGMTQVLSPDSTAELLYTRYTEDAYVTASASTLQLDCGRGRLLGAKATLDAFRAIVGQEFCILIQ